MDKVQKIREEVVRLVNNHDSALDYEAALEDVLNIIDSLQEEQEHFLEDAPATDYEVPKIEAWLAREDETDTQLGYLYLYLHKPIRAEDVGQWIGHNGVIVWNEGKYKALKWEDEPLKVSLSILGDKPKKCMFTKEEFTEEDRKILCEDCEEECEYAKKEEPVSEDLEDAANNALERMLDKYGLVGTGSCLEMFKLGAEWQKTKDESCSKDLGEYINELSKQFPEVSFAKLSRIAVRVAKWQKEKDFQYLKKECERTGSCCDNDIAIEAAKRHPYYYASEMEAYANIGFKEGAMWQKEQFEKNRLAHCDKQTGEEAEREQDFVMGIIDNEHRKPTYDDAIKYGMRLQKEQMMANAVNAVVETDANGLSCVNVDGVDVGNKVKVLVIKGD